MSLTRTLEAVETRARLLAPVDLTTRLDRFQYQFDGNAVRALPFGGGQPLLLHDLALRQLASRVQVPIDYLKRCPKNLADLNLGYWTQQTPVRRESLFRTIQGNQVRSIHTDSYQPFDDVDVLPLVAEALGDDEVQVQLFNQDDNYTHLRLVFPRMVAEARPGDYLYGAIHISNSETGLRSVQISSLVYRLVCTNGLVRPETTSKVAARHIGNPARMRDFIANAVREAKLGTVRLVEEFKASVHRTLEEPLKLIERTAAEGSLTQEQFQRILTSFATEGDTTLYGAINAFTHAAQAEPTVEARYQMERTGAQLLRLV